MNCPQRAVCFLEEDSSIPAHSKPLMLEAVLFCPILTWVGDKLRADGVERFFIVCGPTFAEEVRRCFPADADVIVSEQQKDLMEFLNTPDQVLVLPRAALPLEEADLRLLQEAQAAARSLLQSDPGLSRPENRPVLERVRRLFADTPDIFN